jgi:arylsulfatase A-like enzyme
VVIYLIDTLRRDRLGCYGYEKPITPQIDAFAARATLYEDAVGQSSWTKASVASTFTGVWPPAHGAISWHQAVPERFDTLAELLERAGYATAAYSANPNIVPHFGFDQGFQSFTKHPKLLSAELNALAFEWLADIPEGQTFFLYMQPVDPHAGYNPPKEFLDRHAPGVDPWGWRGKAKWKWPLKALPTLLLLYDAEIAANDDSFGALLDELERRGLYDSALIVLTSDHGEEFREHGGWRHGSHLYRETLDVPLVIKYPGQVEGRRVTGAAQHIDILPTVLEVAGIPVPDGLEGMSLVGAAASLPERRAYSHLRLGSKPAHLALIEGDWKLIQRLRGDQTDAFLYNLADDPGEQEDVAGSFPVRAAAMTALLEERLAQATVEAETVELDAELERDLRALGYLQ